MVIAILSFNGKLTYGYGLGDVFYLVIYLVASIALTIITIFMYRKNRNINKINMMFTVVLIIHILQITYLRGSEMPWNGIVFFSF